MKQEDSASSSANGASGQMSTSSTLPEDGQRCHPCSPADTVQAMVSPALESNNGVEHPAFELKFLISDAQAATAAEWAARNLVCDPHVDPGLGNAYRITSIYFDTQEFDVFHRAASYKNRKYRLRRYGSEDLIYVERKSKWGDRVKKKRSTVPGSEIAKLENGFADEEWAGRWFHRQIRDRQLRPVCQITYERVAYVGQNSEGSIRLTIDRNVHCVPVKTCLIQDVPEGRRLLPDQFILEFKFRTALPALLKQLMQELGLSTTSVSKYRTGVQASGLVIPRAVQ